MCALVALRGGMIDLEDLYPGQFGHAPCAAVVSGAEYDEQGFWEFASLRNFLYYAGGYLLVVWGLGAWHWGEKQAALATVCRTVAHSGIVPVFCV